MQPSEHQKLVGAEVGWFDRDGCLLTGTVTCYHSRSGKPQLQIKRPDGSHLWFMVGELDRQAHDRFCIIRYGDSMLDYGLNLANQILQGQEPSRPIDPRLTTLAATVTALETQLRQVTDASEMPSGREQAS